jgi:hypothetical protein
MSKNISIKEFLEGSYAEPIDLSTITEFQEVKTNEEHIDKRSRQVANGEWLNNDSIIFDLLNITEPIFNLRDEFNTISIFLNTNITKYPEFKDFLNEYIHNANVEKNAEKALALKSTIMQFIADKMNGK